MTITIQNDKPDNWESLCEQKRYYLFSEDWLNVLRLGLNSKGILFITKDQMPYAVVNIFHRYLFRAGYINFPIGLEADANDDVWETLSATHALPYDVIRVMTVTQQSYGGAPSTQPRTLIPDLSTWSDDRLPSALKRNINKAKKSRVAVRPAPDDCGHALYAIYLSVIKRHRGSVRYSPKYFNELLAAHLRSNLLNIYVACRDDQLIGFMATALHQDTTYYLHGGIRMAYSHYRPMDLLFFHAIKRAIENSAAQCFDFLGSPPDQPSLVRYKEKWGATTVAQRHRDGYQHSAKAGLLWLANRFLH